MRSSRRPAEGLGIGRIGEAHGDAHGGQRVGEQVPGAAVEIGRAHDVVARPAQVLDRQHRRRLPGADGQCRHAALERGDPLLQHIAGRVHDARIDVAEVLEREQVGRVLRAAELDRTSSDRSARPRRRLRHRCAGRHAAPWSRGCLLFTVIVFLLCLGCSSNCRDLIRLPAARRMAAAGETVRRFSSRASERVLAARADDVAGSRGELDHAPCW